VGTNKKPASWCSDTFESVNTLFEKWLHRRCSIVAAGLKKKHKRMRASAFDFLRATYFRWAGCIETLCPGLVNAPPVLSVGDLHVENFGTWRDADGRLVWGINDFDEAAVMPYTWDLVRLVTSARLVLSPRFTTARVATAVLSGYCKGLDDPRPTVLDHDNRWIRRYVEGTAASDLEFWREIDQCPDTAPPREVKRGLMRALPKRTEKIRFATRTAGGGSLGRPRYIVVGKWQGAPVVREAKALVPSAWLWAHGIERASIKFNELSTGRFRSPDPFLEVSGRYIYRRLAPDSRKIDFPKPFGRELSERLLEAMGRDLGAVHAAGISPRKILKDLETRDRGWLESAAQLAEKKVLEDFAAFSGSGQTAKISNA
jgi:hypothetical protein